MNNIKENNLTIQKNQVTQKNLIECYGCGALVTNSNEPRHAYIGSDSGCWEIFCEVLAKEYMNYNDLWKSHRLTVDTYAAQHPGKPERKAIQSVYIHLSRLYLQLEKGVSGKQANDFMKNVGQYKHEYHELNAPDFSGVLTVTDVAKAADMAEHKLLVEKWAKGVWDAWSEHHNEIKAFADKVLEESYKCKNKKGITV